MEQERTNWNDARLDHLADQVDRLAGQVTALGQHMDDRFDAQNARMDDRFDTQNARIDERFARIDKRFDTLQYAMIVTLASLLATFAAAQL